MDLIDLVPAWALLVFSATKPTTYFIAIVTNNLALRRDCVLEHGAKHVVKSFEFILAPATVGSGCLD